MKLRSTGLRRRCMSRGGLLKRLRDDEIDALPGQVVSKVGAVAFRGHGARRRYTLRPMNEIIKRRFNDAFELTLGVLFGLVVGIALMASFLASRG